MSIYKIAKASSKELLKLDVARKNEILNDCANELIKNVSFIIKENEKDINEAKKNNLKTSLIDRLMLDENRINNMAKGIKKIANASDPLAKYSDVRRLENGLKIAKRAVAFGVIGIIYEARPNVTSDVFAMCFKAGSSVILKGGKEAINSNKAIVKILKDCIKKNGFNPDVLSYLEGSKESVLELIRMNEYVDLIIPRGGAGLIKNVVENSTVPVIETGVGNCHIYVDLGANVAKSIDIIKNAKMQRPSVCNALETLLIHTEMVELIMPKLLNLGIKLICDESIKSVYDEVELACENDWSEEYLDNVLAVKRVQNLDEAINHIEKYSSGHSEGIITENYTNASKFCDLVDSAAVYVNASTRFSDGECFGLGAEIGISTQKLHARGPMGLDALVSYKYVVLGDYHIR